MQKVTATNARKEFFEIIRKANEQHRIYQILHRTGNAVLMSEGEYESLMETLELLSIPGFSESIKRSSEQVRNGQTVSFDDIFGASDK